MRSPHHPGPVADAASFSPSRRNLLRTATVAGLATAVPAVLVRISPPPAPPPGPWAR